MFEFSLENGKRQLKNGLQMLIATVVIVLVWGIIIGICAGVGTEAAGVVGLVFSIILLTCAGIVGLISAIKIIFGAVVYHAERTSARHPSVIEKEVKTI